MTHTSNKYPALRYIQKYVGIYQTEILFIETHQMWY